MKRGEGGVLRIGLSSRLVLRSASRSSLSGRREEEIRCAVGLSPCLRDSLGQSDALPLAALPTAFVATWCDTPLLNLLHHRNDLPHSPRRKRRPESRRTHSGCGLGFYQGGCEYLLPIPSLTLGCAGPVRSSSADSAAVTGRVHVHGPNRVEREDQLLRPPAGEGRRACTWIR